MSPCRKRDPIFGPTYHERPVLGQFWSRLIWGCGGLEGYSKSDHFSHFINVYRICLNRHSGSHAVRHALTPWGSEVHRLSISKLAKKVFDLATHKTLQVFEFAMHKKLKSWQNFEKMLNDIWFQKWNRITVSTLNQWYWIDVCFSWSKIIFRKFEIVKVGGLIDTRLLTI